MNLLDQYLSEEEEEEVKSKAALERGIGIRDSQPRLKPLPDQILDKYHISPNIEKYSGEDMNTIARGWTSFAFVEMRPSHRQRLQIDSLVHTVGLQLRSEIGLEFQPLHISELGSPLPLHVSLGPNFSFQTSQELNAFAQMLQVETWQKMNAPFEVGFEPILQIYDNVDRNALFLALDVSQSVKNSHIRRLWTAVQESLDFSRRSDECAASRCAWTFERSHMSIARAFLKPPSIKAAGGHTSAERTLDAQYRRTIEQLNMLLANRPVDRSVLDSLRFQCSGIKLTKQRSNLWIPFGSDTQ
ncbi:LADA_0F02014g1_1 [Lachancea dasiensis]|uniref:LADA_0F02014g1_1 n=1 Tax=Lachancea dasiensis TaxID=1072105 RepID=A0A1G4JI74_9SACH|nr:LADA_0F02014g1_1 [Lachancea dasiensis]